MEKIEGSHANEAELIAYLHDFLSFDLKFAKKYLLQFSGRSGEHCENEDPFVLQKDPDRLLALTNVFVYHVRATKGVPYTKAKLAGEALMKYFPDRSAGGLKPRPSMLEAAMSRARQEPEPSAPEHGLCPDPVTVEFFLSGMFHFMMPRPYDAAAFFSLMPSWLIFLESAGLLDEDRRGKTIGELKPVALSLVKALEARTDDSRLSRDVAAAWTE